MTKTTELNKPKANGGEPSADLGTEAVDKISGELRHLLADVFVLYVKTKNYHWHMSGRNFRDYHLLLDEQGEQLFEMTDDIAEKARKIGGKPFARLAISPNTNG
jgi:starvation-inducible DNA-binding protein